MSTATVMHESDTINLVKDERIIVTPINDACYAEAHEKMTFVYTWRGSYIMPMNVTEFCSKLPLSCFFRYHRPLCVNLNKICEIEPWFNSTYILRPKDLDFEVPASRSKMKEFRQLMHLQSGTFMKAPGLSADQQLFADLLSDLVPNPQLLGCVWFASQPALLPVGSLCIDFPRLDIVLHSEYDNLLEAKQQRMVEEGMLFILARTANLPINDKSVMLLGLVFAPTRLGLSFHDSRTTSLLHPACQIQFPSLQRGEGEAMLTVLTHLSHPPLEQSITQPLVLGLLHLYRNVVSMPPGSSQPRGDFLYHSICNWVQDNYAQPLIRKGMAQSFNITPNHLSKLFAQHGTVHFIEYVCWVRMAKARIILQKYHLSTHEVTRHRSFLDNDYSCRVFRRQFGLTPGEYNARFQS